MLGDNETLSLGNDSVEASETALPIADLSGVTALAAGGGSSCAVMADTSVRCWGLLTFRTRNLEGRPYPVGADNAVPGNVWTCL